MATLEEYVAGVQKKGSVFLTDLDKYEKELIAKIRELTARGRDEIISTQRQITSSADESRAECVNAKEIINKCIAEVKRSQRRKASSVIVFKQGQDIVKRGEAILKKSEDLVNNTTFAFCKETQLENSLKVFTSLVTNVSTRKTTERPPTTVQKTEKYKTRKNSDINLKISVDKETCNNTGLSGLADGTLVVCDNANSKLKHVNPKTNTVIDHRNMGNKPLGVCCICQQEVAVSN